MLSLLAVIRTRLLTPPFYMTQSTVVVLSSIDGAVARLTLNRPEKKNALNDQLISELTDALTDAASHEDVRTIVITGSGTDFCSGADLAALEKIGIDSSRRAETVSVDEFVKVARELVARPAP